MDAYGGTATADQLLAECIASHFGGARVLDSRPEGTRVEVGFGDVVIDCHLDRTLQKGATWTAALFFRISAPALGPEPVFASFSGYQATQVGAVVEGGCRWCCSFGPVLQAALGGQPADDVAVLAVEVDGRPRHLVIDALDRVVGDESLTPSLAVAASARQRLAGQRWLAPGILADGGFAPWPADRASVVSVFVAESPRARTVEIKADGVDVPTAGAALRAAAPTTAPAQVLLRELGILLPATP